MKLEPPEKVSQEQITIDVREIEPLLQAPPMNLKPWPEAMITMKDGRILYIRQATLADVPPPGVHEEDYGCGPRFL